MGSEFSLSSPPSTVCVDGLKVVEASYREFEAENVEIGNTGGGSAPNE